MIVESELVEAGDAGGPGNETGDAVESDNTEDCELYSTNSMSNSRNEVKNTYTRLVEKHEHEHPASIYGCLDSKGLSLPVTGYLRYPTLKFRTPDFISSSNVSASTSVSDASVKANTPSDRC